MLDQNLPGFLLCESADKISYHETVYHTRDGSEPAPTYSLRHADPALDSSRNCYAVALFDAFSKEVLYGEVFLQPKWSQPTLSQEEIRKNGGIAPPPHPVMPAEFTIQLYNPEQQILVQQKVGKLVNTPRWEFSLPQATFREPSTSMLDRSQDDPTAEETTPKINFVWKKETKFGKDLGCFVTGKSTDVANTKKKNKDPDIAVALIRGFKELTIYEPNLYRIDMEDLKGLEVALLLGVCVIRDVFLGMKKNPFNISEPGPRRSSKETGVAILDSEVASSSAAAGPGRHGAVPPSAGPVAAPPAALNTRKSHTASGPAVLKKAPTLKECEELGLVFDLTEPYHPLNNNRPRGKSYSYGESNNDPGYKPPVTDPRTQWEIDAESARLKKQVEAEEREQRRIEAARRKEQERIDKEETKRLRKLVEQEEKQRRDEQRRVEEETERLRKIYGNQAASPARPSPPPQSWSAPVMQSPFPPQHHAPHPQQHYYGHPAGPAPPMPPRPQQSGPYLQAPMPGRTAQTSAPNLTLPQNPNGDRHQRRSFWDLRSLSLG